MEKSKVLELRDGEVGRVGGLEALVAGYSDANVRFLGIFFNKLFCSLLTLSQNKLVFVSSTGKYKTRLGRH
jgi:hypothetical protein